MSEIRHDPLTGRHVIIATQRAQRPIEFTEPIPLAAGIVPPPSACPFCPGNESETPTAVAVYSAGDVQGLPNEASDSNSAACASDWSIRVVPNKYPAVGQDECESTQDEPLFLAEPAAGIHEVIIESSKHVRSFSELPVQDAIAAFRMYQSRLTHANESGRKKFGIVFKNCRAAAGASIDHIHSQLIATDIVPADVQTRIRCSQQHFEDRGTTLISSLLAAEERAKTRIVESTADCVSICPYASDLPYKTLVIPREPCSHFENASHVSVRAVAEQVHSIIKKLEDALDGPAYNFVIRSAPFDIIASGHYHWHVEIFPRTTVTAGYEWGTGCFINPVCPDEAAAVLRASC